MKASELMVITWADRDLRSMDDPRQFVEEMRGRCVEGWSRDGENMVAIEPLPGEEERFKYAKEIK